MSDRREELKSTLVSAFEVYHAARRRAIRRTVGVGACASVGALIAAFAHLGGGASGHPSAIDERPAAVAGSGVHRPSSRIVHVATDSTVTARLTVAPPSTTRIIGDAELAGLLRAPCGPVGLIRIDSGTKVLAACAEIPPDVRFTR